MEKNRLHEANAVHEKYVGSGIDLNEAEKQENVFKRCESKSCDYHIQHNVQRFVEGGVGKRANAHHQIFEKFFDKGNANKEVYKEKSGSRKRKIRKESFKKGFQIHRGNGCESAKEKYFKNHPVGFRMRILSKKESKPDEAGRRGEEEKKRVSYAGHCSIIRSFSSLAGSC